jgi:hypothetical protein
LATASALQLETGETQMNEPKALGEPKAKPERYTGNEIAEALDETLAECAREPATQLWRAFWDRLTLGGDIPQRQCETTEIYIRSMDSLTYCCSWMEAQAKMTCQQHPERTDCPDVIIHRYQTSFGIPIHDGSASCIEINYCPHCGSQLDQPRQDFSPTGDASDSPT